MTIKWPDIGDIKRARAHAEYVLETYGVRIEPETYRGKVKLHGTNSGVRLRGGVVEAFQSREIDLTIEEDNAGFATWGSKVTWPNLNSGAAHTVTIFGEWAGPGVHKGTGVNQIPRKMFFVFGIAVVSDEICDTGEHSVYRLVLEPAEIEQMLGPDLLARGDIHVIPWYEPLGSLQIDLLDPDSLKAAADRINQEVEKIEDRDPYISDLFGIDGVGEGLVLYPSNRSFRRLAFKAKGEVHRVKKAAKAVEVNPEILRTTQAFVEAFVTEARCEQGASVVGGTDDLRKIGDFIQWVVRDVEKESTLELAEAGLTFKQVSGAVSKAAQRWFMARNKAL